MGLTLTPPMRSLLGQKTHRFAKAFELRRTDGEILRLTDSTQELVFGGFTYTPTGSGNLSATRRVSGLEDAGADFVGVLNSDAITYDDLWAGRYREAKITTYLVDWRYPWPGQYSKTVHWIMETTFDGERWKAQLSSISGWLRYDVGGIHGRTCELTLYSERCGVSKGGFALATSSMEVLAIVTQRRIFTTSDQSNSQSDGYYDGGELLWLSGANQGIKSQIKVYTESIPTAAVQIELELETPHEITTSDQFAAWAGCNKLGRTGDCKNKFNNMINFGGYQDMPGTDRMVQVPTR